MADERMTEGAVGAGPGQTIHFSTVFDGGKTPVACGRTEQPLPASPEWRYVGCPPCLALALPKDKAPAAEVQMCRGCRRPDERLLWMGAAGLCARCLRSTETMVVVHIDVARALRAARRSPSGGM